MYMYNVHVYNVQNVHVSIALELKQQLKHYIGYIWFPITNITEHVSKKTSQ